MMRQGELSFKYEEEGQGVGMTAIAGIAPYLDLACRSGMVRGIERNVKAREGGQGWTDGKMVLSTIVAANKAEALWCYKGYRAYQRLNTWWAE